MNLTFFHEKRVMKRKCFVCLKEKKYTNFCNGCVCFGLAEKLICKSCSKEIKMCDECGYNVCSECSQEITLPRASTKKVSKTLNFCLDLHGESMCLKSFMNGLNFNLIDKKSYKYPD